VPFGVTKSDHTPIHDPSTPLKKSIHSTSAQPRRGGCWVGERHRFLVRTRGQAVRPLDGLLDAS
jgi:hypothetical protein